MLNALLILLINFSFNSHALERNFGSECYESQLGEDGRPVNRPVVVTIPGDEKIIMSGRLLWPQADYERVHRLCRENHGCMFAADTSYRRDDDAEGGWNEVLIGTITCSNRLASGGYVYRNSYSNGVSRGNLEPFLNADQIEVIERRNQAGNGGAVKEEALDD